MKAAKIAKTIVMAPAFVCVVASYGAQEIVAKSIAYATGNKFAQECGEISESLRKAAIDCMVGKN